MLFPAGRERLSGILGVTTEQASQFQDSFLQTYKEVQVFIQRTIQQCHKQGLCTFKFLFRHPFELDLKVILNLNAPKGIDIEENVPHPA